MTKVCGDCHVEKDLADFYQNRNGGGQHYPMSCCKPCQTIRVAARNLRDRLEVLAFLGGRCVCCGEDRYQFLEIDHPNQDGGEHRKRLPKGRITLKNARDDGYVLRILCANCHLAITGYGVCPHA